MKIKEYHTTDITLAAALSALGCKFAQINIAKERSVFRGIFIFIDVPEEFLSRYDNGVLQLEVTSFHNAVKRLSAAAKRAIEKAKTAEVANV